MAKKDGEMAITRRDCIAGAAAATLLGTQPVSAQGQDDCGLDTRLSGPPGHRREAPRFRRLDLDK